MADPFDPRQERAAPPRPFALSTDRRLAAEAGDPAAGPFDRADTASGPMSRHAAEWGLASLLMGGVLILFAPPAWIFMLIYWNTGRNVVGAADPVAIHIMVLGMMAAILSLIALSGVSLAIGIRALQSAARRRQPAGLPLAGAVLSGAALAFAVCTSAGFLAVVLTFGA